MLIVVLGVSDTDQTESLLLIRFGCIGLVPVLLSGGLWVLSVKLLPTISGLATCIFALLTLGGPCIVLQ